jgi:hypothetical protein
MSNEQQVQAIKDQAAKVLQAAQRWLRAVTRNDGDIDDRRAAYERQYDALETMKHDLYTDNDAEDAGAAEAQADA